MIGALIQSRLDSSRFPGKALEYIGDYRLIERCIINVKSSKHFTPVLITSDREVDTPLVKIAEQQEILHFRGEINDVAKRALDCIKHFKIAAFARVNGDSPFVMPSLLDQGYDMLQNEKLDFISNIIERSFPYGVSVEIFRSDIFADAYEEIKKDKYLQEHYTTYFYRNLDRFKHFSLTRKPDISKLHLTVDLPEDIIHLRSMLDFCPELFQSDLDTIAGIYNKTKISKP
jgi:spore coat polysaccharide biosynthesis protein SpsF